MFASTQGEHVVDSSLQKEKPFQGGTLPGVPIQYDSFLPEFKNRTAFHILTHLHAGLYNYNHQT